MKVAMLCGKETIDLELPAAAQVLATKPAPALSDPPGEVTRALAEPIAAPPLAELARGRRDACVVISDITRPVPNRIILPPLLAALEEAGIPRERITLLIATGMHRPNQGAELESMIGPETMRDYRVVNHFCRDQSQYRLVDHIAGAPIEINRHYLDADLKILTGLIEPHMYAGYSGGRKSILPGLSSFTTMQFMHSFKMIAHPKVSNCVLDQNPFHEAGLKVMDLVGADFLLNVVVNQERQIVGVFAGHPDRAHRQGCGLVEEHAVVYLDAPADLVITSAGGYPLDATFYQVSKGLIMASEIVRPGGTIVVICGCAEGLGSPEYCSLVREGRTPEEFYEHFGTSDNFVIDQWCLQTTFQALDHAGQIFAYSPGLPKADLAAAGITKMEDLQSEVDALLPGHARVAVAPQGPYVVGRLAA